MRVSDDGADIVFAATKAQVRHMGGIGLHPVTGEPVLGSDGDLGEYLRRGPTHEEMAELANFMIAQWTKVLEKAVEGRQGRG